MIDALLSLIGKGFDAFSSSSNTDKNNATQMAIAQQNIALQKEFAQSGVQWKTQDAIKAGIHPLAALGANTSSFSPVSVATESPKTDFGGMGQDLGRALKAAQSDEERNKQDDAKARRLTLEKGELENDVLRADLRSKLIRQSVVGGQIGPPMPTGPARDLPGNWASMVTGSPLRSSSGQAIAEDDMKSKQDSAPGVRNVNLWGVTPWLKTNPNRASGQDLENEYGEYGGGALALPNVVSDFAYTAGQALPPWITRPVPHRPSASERRWRRKY